MQFSKALTLTLLSSTTYLLTINGAVIASSQLSLFRQLSNPATNASTVNLATLNNTLNDRGYYFSFVIKFGDTDLNQQSLLSNAVETLTTLAQRDYNAHVSGFHGHWPASADVNINVRPYSAVTDFSNKVAINRINEAIYYIVTHSWFKEAEVDCRWEDVVTAQVLFEAVEGTGSITDLDITTSPTPVNATPPSLNALEARFHFPPDSQSLTIWEVHIIVMQALTSIAQYPSTDAVPQFFVVKARARAISNANMQFVEVGARRTRPPFFEYRYVINTVRQIPAWMRSQGRFGEIGIAIAVDRLDLGTGFLNKGLQQLRSIDGVPMFNQSVAVS